MGGSSSPGSILCKVRPLWSCMHPKSMGIVFERGDVDEEEFAQNYFLEAKAVLEGGKDDNVGTTGEGEFNLVIGTQCSNQPNNGLDLIAKVMKILMGRQMRRGMTEAGGRSWAGEGETVRQCQGIKRQRRGSGYFFFVCLRSAQGGRKQG
jgi:hypothetical protein